VNKGKESRTLQTEEQLLTVTLEEALALLATPRVFGKGRAAAKPPLREFGIDPASEKPVVGKEGKFGDYITDGETNAGLTRGDRMEQMTNERAYELLQLRREYIEANGGPKKKAGGRKVAAKKAPAKKTAVKKAAAKKAPAKKAAAKKAAPKKKAASTSSGDE
jgi:DNA topoisomerase-1